MSHCPTCLPHVHPSACVCSGTNNVRHRYVALKVFRCSRPMSAVPHLFMSEFFLFNKIIKMRIDRRTWRFFFSQTQRCDSRSALIVMTSQEMLQSISIKKQLDFLRTRNIQHGMLCKYFMIQVVRTVVQHDSTNARTSLCRSKMNETNKYFIQTIRETGVNVGKFNKITKCQKLTCRIREFQRLRELREGSEIFPVVPGPCSIAFWLSSSFPTRFCCWLSSAGSWRRRWWRQRRREQNPACGGGGYALAAGTFSFFFFTGGQWKCCKK